MAFGCALAFAFGSALALDFGDVFASEVGNAIMGGPDTFKLGNGTVVEEDDKSLVKRTFFTCFQRRLDADSASTS